MATDRELRATSDELLGKLAALHDLEVKKRAATPGSPEFIDLSRAVETAARDVLGSTIRQTDIAVETIARTDISGRPIEEIAPPREVPTILAEWREAERRLAAATPESDDFRAAAMDVNRLRDEYRAAFDNVRAGE